MFMNTSKSSAPHPHRPLMEGIRDGLSSKIHSFKYHVSCTDGKISVRINLLFYLFFTVIPSNSCVFLSCRPFVVNTSFTTGLVGVEVSSVSWLGQVTVGILLKIMFLHRWEDFS